MFARKIDDTSAMEIHGTQVGYMLNFQSSTVSKPIQWWKLRSTQQKLTCSGYCIICISFFTLTSLTPISLGHPHSSIWQITSHHRAGHVCMEKVLPVMNTVEFSEILCSSEKMQTSHGHDNGKSLRSQKHVAWPSFEYVYLSIFMCLICLEHQPRKTKCQNPGGATTKEVYRIETYGKSLKLQKKTRFMVYDFLLALKLIFWLQIFATSTRNA